MLFRAAFWLGLVGVGYFYVYPQFKLFMWHLNTTFEPIVWAFNHF